jgi:hypothetical protein
VRRLAAHLGEAGPAADVGDAGRVRAERRVDAMVRRRQARTLRGPG